MGKFQMIQGDIASVRLPQAHYDACLCDPPYGTEFMGKEWDHGVPGAQIWRHIFAALKPGAFLLAFGGTRTHHRLMCAIEDAGFEIRDCMMWIYGSGFPKSLDISKALDKSAGAVREVIGTARGKGGENLNRLSRDGNDAADARGCGAYGCGAKQTDIDIPLTAPATDAAKLWNGFGTALKPAWEPIIVAMKPCEGTFAENALKHGVAGLAIGACRIPATGGSCSGDPGRWPANVLFDEASAQMLDEQSGMLTSGNNPAKRSADKHRRVYAGWKGQQCLVHRGTDSGGASRFFYCAKAPRKERGEGNDHPTVKPLALCGYLARLLLPPAGGVRRLLVPFSGSGSEMIGALQAGWDEVTGVEKESAYCTIAERRLSALPSELVFEPS